MLALLVPVITARPVCGPALGGVIGGRVAEGDTAGTCRRANVRSGGDLSPCPDRQPVLLTPGVVPVLRRGAPGPGIGGGRDGREGERSAEPSGATGPGRAGQGAGPVVGSFRVAPGRGPSGSGRAA